MTTTDAQTTQEEKNGWKPLDGGARVLLDCGIPCLVRIPAAKIHDGFLAEIRFQVFSLTGMQVRTERVSIGPTSERDIEVRLRIVGGNVRPNRGET